jgi:signal transduction histidine kinase
MAKKARVDLLEKDITAGKADLLETIKEKDGQIETLTSRLKSSTELTRMIVHDLKGPLASIMANLDMLVSPKTGRIEREILETAMQGGYDLLNIINTLLEIGKMERGNFELNLSVLDLAQIFKATIGKMKSLAMQKSLALKVDCRSKISSVAADATLIERIIFNLIMNAIKYTREGGTISLMTKDGITKDTVLIAVADTGIGIASQYHETIFDLYTQINIPGERRADGQDSGTDTGAKSASGIERKKGRMANVGVGLAFCKLATEQHGGRIWVESELGKGSTFFVSLPTNLIPSGSGLI